MDQSVNSPAEQAPPAKLSRREQARATRRRILDAAREELVAKGYYGTVMSDIADRAGVSVQMLYFSFGTKPNLVVAVGDAAVLGDEGLPPERTDWFSELAHAPTAAETIRRFIVASGPIFERAGPMMLVQREGAATDPDLSRIVKQRDDLRADGYRRVVEIAAGKGPLRADLDVATATDVLVAVYSPSLYMEFITGRGWTHARTLAWLATAVPGLICDDATATPVQP